jgi:uncharacterized protein YndB with AHSA1/START domain
VYEYFVQPEALVRWMGEFAHLEARPGGAWGHYRARLESVAAGAGPGPDQGMSPTPLKKQ